MKRKILSVFLTLVLVCSFSLVTAVPAAAIVPEVPDRTTAIAKTADRLVALQSTGTLGALGPPDYGWDYDVTGLDEHSGSPSAWNLYGVTALGLIDAYEVTGESSYLTAAGLLADNMTGGDASEGGFFHGANVLTEEVKWYVAQDYQFLMRYAEVSNSTYSDYAVEAWTWQKANLHANRYLSGQAWYDWAIVATNGDVGTVVWQGSAYGLAALAMGDTVWAGEMAAAVSSNFGSIEGDDPMARANALKLLNEVNPEAYSGSIDTLTTQLIDSQNDTSGSWDTGWGELQDTAYAVMSLATVGEAEAAQKGAAWLVASQLADGGWLEEDSGEYSETDSEALQALASVPAPVTIGDDGYYSIQAAIDDADTDAGDTITVAAGTYNESVTVNKSVILLGAKWDVDPRAGAWTGDITTINAGEGNNGILITASGVTVNGFKLIESGTITVEDDLISAESGIYVLKDFVTKLTDIVIKYCWCDNNYGSGITVRYADKPIVEYCYSSNNGGEGANAAGIAGQELTGGSISYNECYNNVNYGIYLGCGWKIGSGENYTGDSGTVVSHNDVHQNSKYGIQIIGYYAPAQNIKVEQNNIHDNGRNGLKIVAAPDNTFSENQFTHNGYDTTTDRYKYGVLLEASGDPSYPCTGNAFTGNSFTDNQLGAIYIWQNVDGSLADTVAHFNNFIEGSNKWGINNTTIFGVGATNNWWGATDGPSEVGTGSGDKVSTNVNFTPWYATETTTPERQYVTVKVGDTDDVRAYSDTIQSGIDAAVDDDTVIVAAETYDEQVVIDKALMLQGMGDATVIQPSGPDKLTSLYTLGNQDGAYWNLQKLASIIEVSGVGTASVTVKDLKVDGVNIDSTGVPYIVGISYGETGGTIDDVTVVNMDTTGVTSSDRTYGIWLDAVTTAVSVEVKESTITLYNKNGINARGAELTVDIHDNTITGPGESPCVPNGILLINGAEGTVGPDNTITNHGYTGQWTACGIATWDVAGVIIEGNPISACGSGIGLSGNPAASQGTTDTIIRENTITGTERGVYLECPDTTNNTITGNDIQGNEYGIYLAGPESPTYDELESVGPGNVAYFNDIMGNTEYGVVNFNPEVSFEATRNYWGHASGPAHELPNDKNDKWVGKGDKVSENVDYKPWLHKSEEGVVDEKKPAYAQSVDLDNTGEYGWNTFSAPIFLDEEADTWAELVDLTDLDYNPAYRFDSDNQTFVLLTTTDNYTITPGEGFFIKMNDVGSLTILYSTAWNPTPPTRPLTAGWNLIGLANLEEMDVDVAFASIAEAPGLAGYSQVVNPIGNAESGPVFAGGTIYVGESYWVYMLGERTLAGFTMTPVKWVP